MSHQSPIGLFCLICGRHNCIEAYDHVKVTEPELVQVMAKNRVCSNERQKLYDLVQNSYDCLLNDLVELVQNDRQIVLQMLKKDDYGFLKASREVSTELVGELACGNYTSLPSKRLIPILQAFQNSTPAVTDSTVQQTQTYQVINDFLEASNLAAIKTIIKEALISPVLLQKKQRTHSITRKVSIRQCPNPEEWHDSDDSIRVDIKGRIITNKSLEAQINNRNVTDHDIVTTVVQLKKLKSLKQIEIRNNRITNLTCKMFAFNLPHLTKLDIRGNNLEDEGIIVLAKNMPALKQFYVCENQITDLAVQEIYSNLKELNLLWMENNKISFAGASLIITLQGLRAISLVGNLFSQDQKQVLKPQFPGHISV